MAQLARLDLKKQTLEHPASGTRPRERRGQPRLAMALPGQVSWAGESHPIRVCDLGVGGLYARGETLPPLETTIDVLVTSPGGPIRFTGVVRWIHELDGFGMQFGLLGARETHAIAQLLRRAQRRSDEVTLKRRFDEL